MSVIGAIEPNLRKAEINRVKRKRVEEGDTLPIAPTSQPRNMHGMARIGRIAIPGFFHHVTQRGIGASRPFSSLPTTHSIAICALEEENVAARFRRLPRLDMKRQEWRKRSNPRLAAPCSVQYYSCEVGTLEKPMTNLKVILLAAAAFGGLASTASARPITDLAGNQKLVQDVPLCDQGRCYRTGGSNARPYDAESSAPRSYGIGQGSYGGPDHRWHGGPSFLRGGVD
jgi:hypothetical protein